MADYADDTVLRQLKSLELRLTTQVERAIAMIHRRYGSNAVRRICEEINESLRLQPHVI